MKQKKRLLAGIIVFLILFIPVLTSAPCLAAEKAYRIKIQSGYPHGDLSMELLKDFAASAEKKSNGRLKVSVFADPEIVPIDQLFDATKVGTVDMLHCGGTFWGGLTSGACWENGN